MEMRQIRSSENGSHTDTQYKNEEYLLIFLSGSSTLDKRCKMQMKEMKEWNQVEQILAPSVQKKYLVLILDI